MFHQEASVETIKLVKYLIKNGEEEVSEMVMMQAWQNKRHFIHIFSSFEM